MAKRSLHRSVGVIGLGDLGNRLAVQELACGNNVLAFDSNSLVKHLANLGVDPDLDTSQVDVRLLTTETVSDILHHCHIVHWAVASRRLAGLQTVPKNCTVVLHDSVMNNSLTALKGRDDKSQFVITHCLMNDNRRVFVSNEFGDHAKVTRHFTSIGLVPRDTTIEGHDRAMARSQGVFALLIKLGIKEELDQAFAAGNLTPSAVELRAAVNNRQANWTQQTIESILDNPQLLPFVRDMTNLLTAAKKHIIEN